ncbi:hypothetical protein L9F63_021438, partial [Diploptera punctata]
MEQNKELFRHQNFPFSLELQNFGVLQQSPPVQAPTLNTEKRGVNPKFEDTACLDGNCQNNAKPGKAKNTNVINFAQKAAQEAKAASEAQEIAGEEAAHQVKMLLAEKAEEAVDAAEAALSGEEVIVDELEEEISELEQELKYEIGELQNAEQLLQTAIQAKEDAAKLVKTLTSAVKLAQKHLADARHAVEEAQQITSEKQQCVESDKQHIEQLKNQCASAHADLQKTKEAEVKAIQAAKSAHDNAERNRRKSQDGQYYKTCFK